jgi:glycine/D-amino acid oxidase-like deaminating enzyme
LARHGLTPARVLDRPGVQSLADLPRLLGGVLWTGTATLHPGLLVRGLRRVALACGVRIYENSPMMRLARTSPPVVRTPAGSLTAERIVLTLNAWSTALPELRAAIVVIASDDAVTEPAPDALARCRYTAGPLVTDGQTFVTGFRTTHDQRINAGVTGGRIGFGSLGGARFEGRSHREAAIRDCLRRAAPALAEAPFVDSWCGPIDRTRSGLPLFGALPTCPDVFYGYGFSGNGIATTPLAGRILASLALGEKDEWSSCGLVRPPEPWLPPEPFRFLGALAVREAVRRQDRLAYANRRPGMITRRLAALAPGGIVTTRLERREA